MPRRRPEVAGVEARERARAIVKEFQARITNRLHPSVKDVLAELIAAALAGGALERVELLERLLDATTVMVRRPEFAPIASGEIVALVRQLGSYGSESTLIAAEGSATPATRPWENSALREAGSLSAHSRAPAGREATAGPEGGDRREVLIARLQALVVEAGAKIESVEVQPGEDGEPGVKLSRFLQERDEHAATAKTALHYQRLAYQYSDDIIALRAQLTERIDGARDVTVDERTG